MTKRIDSDRFTSLQTGLVTFFLTLCYIFSILDRHIISFLSSSIRRDLHIDDFHFGLLQGFAFSIFYAVAGIPIGWAVDRTRRFRMIAVALLVWSLLTVASAYAQNFSQFAALRAGVSIGEAVLTPAAFSILTQNAPPPAVSPLHDVLWSGSTRGLCPGRINGRFLSS